MKEAYLKTAKINQIFNEFQHYLGGALNVNAEEHILKLDNSIGCGSLRGIGLEGGITYLELDLSFFDDVIFRINGLMQGSIYFVYCAKGSLIHNFGATGEKRDLKRFQTGILAGTESEDHFLFFKKDMELKISLIIIQTLASETLQKSTLNDALKKTFFKKNVQENLVYIGSFNLKIAEKIEQLDAIAQTGIVRRLFLEGLVYMILALEIQQHTDDVESKSQYTGSLALLEMETIKELSNFINNYPDIQFTLKYLSRKSGLSPNKLQEGFKLMHSKTVTDYIREVRVVVAENLIRTSDMNISQIVYTVGLTSRSYFSKIFKHKYNCSPKWYKDNQNTR